MMIAGVNEEEIFDVSAADRSWLYDAAVLYFVKKDNSTLDRSNGAVSKGSLMSRQKERAFFEDQRRRRALRVHGNARRCSPGPTLEPAISRTVIEPVTTGKWRITTLRITYERFERTYHHLRWPTTLPIVKHVRPCGNIRLGINYPSPWYIFES